MKNQGLLLQQQHIFDDERSNGTMAMARKIVKDEEQKAKEKGVLLKCRIEDSSRIVRPVRSITTLQPLPTIDPKDKGKGVLVEEEPVKIKIRDQAQRFDEIQARIVANHELAIDDFQPMDTKAIKDSKKKVDSSSKQARGSRKKTHAKKRAGEKKGEESAKIKAKKARDVYRGTRISKSVMKKQLKTSCEHGKGRIMIVVNSITSTSELVNTATHTITVSVVKGNRVTDVKASAGYPQQALEEQRKYFGQWMFQKHDRERMHFPYCLYRLLMERFVPLVASAKRCVLFTETECLVLSPDFKLLDASQVLLRVPRQSNMYNFDLKNVVPSGNLTCLFAKATIDESKLWHRRLGHVNFKTMNKLCMGNLYRGNQTNKMHVHKKLMVIQRSDENDTADDSAGESPIQKPAREATKANNTDNFNTISTPVNAASASRTYNDAGSSFVPLGGSFPNDLLMPDL
ncbi:ribonuclease H-like domain-containing protein [Tanacetum coccineum]